MVDDPRPESLIPYQRYVMEELRGVVARVLQDVAINGLPGGHHFYIGFRSDHPDVKLPEPIRARYPERMKIVLQHKFSGLRVDDFGFHVQLNFSGIPADISVPFAALEEFIDPEVAFALKFEAEPAANRDAAITSATESDKTSPDDKTQSDASVSAGRAKPSDPAHSPKTKLTAKINAAKARSNANPKAKPNADSASDPSSASDKVVSIRDFRKK